MNEDIRNKEDAAFPMEKEVHVHSFGMYQQLHDLDSSRRGRSQDALEARAYLADHVHQHRLSRREGRSVLFLMRRHISKFQISKPTHFSNRKRRM